MLVLSLDRCIKPQEDQSKPENWNHYKIKRAEREPWSSASLLLRSEHTALPVCAVLLAIELNPQALSNLTTWASDSEFSMPANANGADDSLDQPDDRGGGKSGRGPSKGQ